MNTICFECRKEMTCVRVGVVIKINDHHYYSGDKYQCKKCGHTVISGIGLPYSEESTSLVEMIRLEE